MQKPLRILVVEDDKDTNDALTKLLSHRGHSVSSALTGNEAMGMISPDAFDIVFLDIGLPDVSGWDLVLDLKRIAPRMLAVALTGYGYDVDYQNSAQAGFDFHVTKPVEISAIERMLAKLFS